MPSIACFFHALIIVWSMPCLAASCAIVSQPGIASSATLTLNSAEYRFLFPIIGSVLSSGRTKLS